MIRGVYSNPMISVRTGTMTSRSVPYCRGVRQGCPSSPILFDLYINDVFRDVAGISIPNLPYRVPGLLFADDAVVFAETVEDLRASLEGVRRWCDDHEMSININKCGVMAFNSQLQDVNCMFGTERVPCVDTYVYLGVNIGSDLSYKGMIERNVLQGTRALYTLMAHFKNPTPPLFTKLMLVKSVIRPILTYGSEIWACLRPCKAGAAGVKYGIACCSWWWKIHQC